MIGGISSQFADTEKVEFVLYSITFSFMLCMIFMLTGVKAYSRFQELSKVNLKKDGLFIMYSSLFGYTTLVFISYIGLSFDESYKKNIGSLISNSFITSSILLGVIGLSYCLFKVIKKHRIEILNKKQIIDSKSLLVEKNGLLDIAQFLNKISEQVKSNENFMIRYHLLNGQLFDVNKLLYGQQLYYEKIAKNYRDVYLKSA